MRKTVGLVAVSWALLGFGPCSNSEPAAPAEPAKPKDEPEEPAKKKKAPKEDDDFKPAELEKDWVGQTDGTTKEGGTWVIQVYNCSKNFEGPWKGSFKFTLKTQGMSMKGQSVEWPAINFDKEKFDAVKPFEIKTKVTATGPAKMDVDVQTKLEGSLEPTKFFLIREKTQTAAGTASNANVSVPMFGSAEGNKMHKIPLKPFGCADGQPLAPLFGPAADGKKK